MFSFGYSPLTILNVVSYYPQSLSTPLYYLSKISPVVSAIKLIARTANIPYLNYLPKTETIEKVGIAYELAHEIVSGTLKESKTLSTLLTHRATSASLSAIGTTAAMISCGAPAMLIAGGSILSAASAWSQNRRSALLESRERFLDDSIMLLIQGYPYTTNKLDAYVTTEENKTKTTQDTTVFTALDYSKLALDMSIAAGSTFMGQTNLILAPAILANEYRRINRITQKEEQYQAMLSKLTPEDHEKVKQITQKSRASLKQVETAPEPKKLNKQGKSGQGR